MLHYLFVPVVGYLRPYFAVLQNKTLLCARKVCVLYLLPTSLWLIVRLQPTLSRGLHSGAQLVAVDFNTFVTL